MTEARVKKAEEDIINRLIIAAEECDGIVIDDVGDDYVTVKSPISHFLYSWGFNIRAEIAVIYDEEVELEFTSSRRVPLNVTANPKKYQFRWMSALITESSSEIDIPELYDASNSENSDESGGRFFSKSKIKTFSGRAGSRAKLIIKYAIDEVIDDKEIEIDLDEQNTHIRFTGEGLEELKTEIEDTFGQENITIKYTNQNGLEIEL